MSNVSHLIISEECVAETWQTVSGMTDMTEAAALSHRFSTSQPALASYLLEFTESLTEDAVELAYYMGLVLWLCYERSNAGAELTTIQVKDVESCHEKLSQQLAALQGVDDRLIERRILYSDDYPQQTVLRYIVETIYAEPDEDGVSLSEDEKGSLFITLRVVADALESATTPVT